MILDVKRFAVTLGVTQAGFRVGLQADSVCRLRLTTIRLSALSATGPADSSLRRCGMDTTLRQCLLEFVDFKQAALAGIHYEDGTVVPELYWPQFFKHLRILKNHVLTNLNRPIDPLALVPLRMIAALIERLEEHYPATFWDAHDWRDPSANNLTSDDLIQWSRLDPVDARDISRLFYDLAEAEGNAMPVEPFTEILASLNLARRELTWNGRVYRLNSPQLALTVYELAKLKGARTTANELGKLNPELSGVEFKSFRRLRGVDDIAVSKWIKTTNKGSWLELPRRRNCVGTLE